MMPSITLNGVEFPLRDEPPKAGRLMVVARAEKRGQQDAMAAYLDFLESMLADHDPAVFEAAVAEVDFEEISDALTEAASSFGADPTSAGPTSSSNSQDGQQAGAPSSRVVSLSRGTVEIRDTPQSSTA